MFLALIHEIILFFKSNEILLSRIIFFLLLFLLVYKLPAFPDLTYSAHKERQIKEIEQEGFKEDKKRSA